MFDNYRVFRVDSSLLHQNNVRQIDSKKVLLYLTDNLLIDSFPFDEQLSTLNAYLESILPQRGLSMVKNDSNYIIKYIEDMNSSSVIKNKLPALRIVLTQECNFNCKYCPQFNENYHDTNQTIQEEQFSYFIGIAKSIGFESFRFTGGEPLRVGQNFLKIIRENNLTNGNNSIFIATNGSYLKDYIQEFKKIENLTIKVSLDTLTPSKFSEISGVNINVLKDILDSIIALKNNIRIGINTVVTNDNKDDLEALIDFAQKNGLYIKLMDLNWYYDHSPPNFWESNFFQLTSIVADLKEKYKKFDIVRTIGQYGIPMTQIYINDATWIRIKDSSVGSTYSSFCTNCDFFPCQEGLYQLTLTADGKLKVCRHRPDTAIDISNNLLNRSEHNIKAAIFEQLNRFFFDAKFVKRGGVYTPP